MKKLKQSFKCNTKDCKAETKNVMKAVDWLEIEIKECSECGQLIAFSTLYPPKKFIRRSVNLP